MGTKTALMTKQVPWIKLREKVLTDDATVLSVTTRDFANRNVGTGDAVPIPQGINDILITFFGIAKDQSAAFTWTLYGYRGGHGADKTIGGPGQKIAYGTGFLGDVTVVKHPVTGVAVTAYYADQLTITAQYWPQLVSIYDIAGSSGEIATIAFDGLGISHLLCELTNCDFDTSNETDELEAVFTGL